MKGLTVTRVLPNICTDRMEETRDFYASLLGFVRRFMVADPNGLLVNLFSFPG